MKKMYVCRLGESSIVAVTTNIKDALNFFVNLPDYAFRANREVIKNLVKECGRQLHCDPILHRFNHYFNDSLRYENAYIYECPLYSANNKKRKQRK